MKQHLIDLGIVIGGVVAIMGIYALLITFATSYQHEAIVNAATLQPYEATFNLSR